MKKLLIWLITFYQKNISHFSSGCCRFTPTCSQYAITAINTHGVIKGLFLSIYRILRCNPFCKGGFDPVPPCKNNH